jgi:hypothetical protein
MPATPRIIPGETEEEARARRRRIFWIMKMKEEGGLEKKPPRSTTISQEHNLWKDREARREARNATRDKMG